MSKKKSFAELIGIHHGYIMMWHALTDKVTDAVDSDPSTKFNVKIGKHRTGPTRTGRNGLE